MRSNPGTVGPRPAGRGSASRSAGPSGRAAASTPGARRRRPTRARLRRTRSSGSRLGSGEVVVLHAAGDALGVRYSALGLLEPVGSTLVGGELGEREHRTPVAADAVGGTSH